MLPSWVRWVCGYPWEICSQESTAASLRTGETEQYVIKNPQSPIPGTWTLRTQRNLRSLQGFHPSRRLRVLQCYLPAQGLIGKWYQRALEAYEQLSSTLFHSLRREERKLHWFDLMWGYTQPLPAKGHFNSDLLKTASHPNCIISQRLQSAVPLSMLHGLKAPCPVHLASLVKFCLIYLPSAHPSSLW